MKLINKKLFAATTITALMAFSMCSCSTTDNNNANSDDSTGTKVEMNYGDELNYFKSVCEIGNEFKSINSKYSLSDPDRTDSYSVYMDKDSSKEFDFIGTKPGKDVAYYDDYTVDDKDKCTGMHGTAEELLGITEAIEVSDFEKKNNVDVYSEYDQDVPYLRGCLLRCFDGDSNYINFHISDDIEVNMMITCSFDRSVILPEDYIYADTTDETPGRNFNIKASSRKSYNCIDCGDYVVTADLYHIYKYDKATGKLKVIHETDGGIVDMTVYGDKLYFSHCVANGLDNSQKITRLDPETEKAETIITDAASGLSFRIGEDTIEYEKYDTSYFGTYLITASIDGDYISESYDEYDYENYGLKESRDNTNNQDYCLETEWLDGTVEALFTLHTPNGPLEISRCRL